MPYQFTVTGDSQQAQRAVEALDKKVAKLEESNKKLAQQARNAGRASQQSSRGASGAATKLAQDLATTAGAYFGVQAAIQAVTEAMERQNKTVRKANAINQSLAAAQENTLKNLAGLSTKEKQRILDEVIPGIQTRAKFAEQAPLVSAFGAGVSASGDVGATTSAVEAAARLTRNNIDQLETVAAGALDVANATGVKDAAKNFGLLLSSGAVNRIVDPAALSENLAPILGPAIEKVPGQSPQEAATQIGALFGAAAKAATDTTGKRTGTELGTFLGKKIPEFFERGVKVQKDEAKLLEKRGVNIRTDELGRKFVQPPEDPGTIAGRIELLQSNKELARAFLEGNSFGAKFANTAEMLLTNRDAPVSRNFRDAMQTVTFDTGLYKQTADEIEGATAALRNATNDAKLAAQLEQNLQKRATAVRPQRIREVLESAQGKVIGLDDMIGSATGLPFNLENMADRIGQYDDPTARAIELLEMRKSDIIADYTGQTFDFLNFGGMAATLGQSLGFDTQNPFAARAADFEFFGQGPQAQEALEAQGMDRPQAQAIVTLNKMLDELRAIQAGQQTQQNNAAQAAAKMDAAAPVE